MTIHGGVEERGAQRVDSSKSRRVTRINGRYDYAHMHPTRVNTTQAQRTPYPATLSTLSFATSMKHDGLDGVDKVIKSFQVVIPSRPHRLGMVWERQSPLRAETLEAQFGRSSSAICSADPDMQPRHPSSSNHLHALPAAWPPGAGERRLCGTSVSDVASSSEKCFCTHRGNKWRNLGQEGDAASLLVE